MAKGCIYRYTLRVLWSYYGKRVYLHMTLRVFWSYGKRVYLQIQNMVAMSNFDRLGQGRRQGILMGGGARGPIGEFICILNEYAYYRVAWLALSFLIFFSLFPLFFSFSLLFFSFSLFLFTWKILGDGFKVNMNKFWQNSESADKPYWFHEQTFWGKKLYLNLQCSDLIIYQ